MHPTYCTSKRVFAFQGMDLQKTTEGPFFGGGGRVGTLFNPDTKWDSCIRGVVCLGSFCLLVLSS